MTDLPDIANYRKPLKVRPRIFRHGDPLFEIPASMVYKRDEIALGLWLISQRPLFGLCYRLLHDTYFESMPQRSGVLIRGFIPTGDIMPGTIFPGDIDLLVIPFENDELILSKTMAIELKAVRAKFSKQGKSPNEFGFSQASALLSLGFPYVGVGHLIVSDTSPADEWRTMSVARIINGDTGAAELLEDVDVDMMPADLIRRSYGRLVKNSPDPAIGLLASYLSGEGNWMPSGREATFNPAASIALMDAVADYYTSNAEYFLETLRYPPE